MGLAIQQVLDFRVVHLLQVPQILPVDRAIPLGQGVRVDRADQGDIFGMEALVEVLAAEFHLVQEDQDYQVCQEPQVVHHVRLGQECREVRSGIGNNCLVEPDWDRDSHLAGAVVAGAAVVGAEALPLLRHKRHRPVEPCEVVDDR